MQHKDLAELDFDNPDSSLGKTIMDACIDALAGHYASKKQKVWNLGHDTNKWPEEVQAIATETAIANIDAVNKLGDNVDFDSVAKAIAPNMNKAMDSINELDIDVETFGYRFVQAITCATFALGSCDTPEEAMEHLADRMKEVEMEEHGYRFAPPQGTTMH